MNSTTSLAARQYRLKQWGDQIRECQNRSDEISVKEWCSLHGLTAATYYYRLREIRKACLENISCSTIPQSIVPVPSQFISGSDFQSASVSGVEISVNRVCIHVTNDTSAELLRMVLQVAADVK